MSDAFFSHIRFLNIINPFFEYFYVVVTNVFWEDMILLLDFLYPVCYKTKVLLPGTCNYCIAFAHNSPLRVIKFQWIKAFPSNVVLSHKPNQIIRSWPPYAIQLKIKTGIFQGVTSLRSLLYLVSFTNYSEQPKICKDFPHVAFPAFNSAEKIRRFLKEVNN